MQPQDINLDDIPKLAILGRSNVGKSSLFNRLSGSRRAIVGARAGLTVDRQELLVRETPLGKPIYLVDTGGVGEKLQEKEIREETKRAALEALQEADIVLFMVDGSFGLHPQDEEVLKWVRKNAKIENDRLWLVANKKDRKDFNPDAFYKIGARERFAVSCEHNLGIENLWDSIEEKLQDFKSFAQQAPTDPDVLREMSRQKPGVLIMGRPNVGKSTLVNALLGEKRSAVSNIAGTTRDVIESPWMDGTMNLKLFDSAGLRQPGRRERDTEWVAAHKIKRISRDCDLALVVIDADEGVTDQDAAVCGLALEEGLSLLLVYNKMDLLDGEEGAYKNTQNQRKEDLKLDFLRWVPKIKISAKTGRGIQEIPKRVAQLLEARKTRVQTSKLNKLFEGRIRSKDHPHVEGPKRVKFYYISQVSQRPPEFILFCNVNPDTIHFSFKRFVINTLRSEFGFEGSPIRLHFKERKSVF